jgi:hypothetical protein
MDKVQKPYFTHHRQNPLDFIRRELVGFGGGGVTEKSLTVVKEKMKVVGKESERSLRKCQLD